MDNTVYQYFPSPQMDYILLQWLDRMRCDGELDKIISRNSQTPSVFLSMFQVPRQLYFKLDELGNLALACWVEPCMGSVFLGYYAQPAYRKNREVAHFIFDMFEAIFSHGIPVVCGFIQERPSQGETQAFVDLHRKLGYEYRGKIPKFFDGKDCHIVAMTADSWAKPHKMKERWQRDRHKKSEAGALASS